MTPPRPIRRLLAWVVFEADIEPLELWTALFAMTWGAWVANPSADLFATADGFTVMALIPEWLWGCAALFAGIAQLAGLFSGHARLRRFGAAALIAFWLFAAGALSWGAWQWTSTVTYPMLAMASLLVSYRASRRITSGPRADDRGD